MKAYTISEIQDRSGGRYNHYALGCLSQAEHVEKQKRDRYMTVENKKLDNKTQKERYKNADIYFKAFEL